MIKWFRRLIQRIKTMRYFLSYSKETIIQSLDRNKRALKIAIKYPITQESARKMIDVCDAMGVDDGMIERTLALSTRYGIYTAEAIVYEVFFTLNYEFLRKARK